MIVASPQVIPYRVQYWLDVQYAVERIHFDAAFGVHPWTFQMDPWTFQVHETSRTYANTIGLQ